MFFLRTPLSIIAVSIMSACASSGSNAPAAAGPSSGGGVRFVWQDLITTDVKAARQFYSALLGWEFTDATRNGAPYAIARTAAGPVGGVVDVHDRKDAGSQWVSYVAVSDVDAVSKQVESAGGRILVPPTPTGAGRVSVVADPQGAALGFVRPAKTPPADPAQPVARHFFWREYLAKDSVTALAFYKTLLGYETSTTDARLGLEYFVLRSDRPRAGLFQLPAAATQVRPNWLPYILVDDPSALSARVAGLGGRVMLEPSAERRNFTLAVVADPTGGVVALQKFPM